MKKGDVPMFSDEEIQKLKENTEDTERHFLPREDETNKESEE